MTGVIRVSSALRACVASLALALISLSPANALDGRVLQDAAMRISPSADSPVVGTVPADTAVLINGCAFGEGYCAVRHGGRLGWIPSASVNVTGITRSTNRIGESVVVLDLTDQLAMTNAYGSDRGVAIADIPNLGNQPIVRFAPGRGYGSYDYDSYGYGPYKQYSTSSSDRYLDGSRYYDRRSAQHYDHLMRRLNRHDSGLVNPRTRRYRSFVGRNDESIRPNLRFNRFIRDDVSTSSPKKRKRRKRRRHHD